MSEKTLQLHDLAIGYPGLGRPVASEIQASLSCGEIVCLVGPNGVGKTTLLRTLAGMQKPISGMVTLSGQDMHRLKPDELARRVSVVLTERLDMGLLTGYELVMLGRHPYTNWMGQLSTQDKAAVRNAIKAVDAEAFAQRPVYEMSDGQRQKVMIARALAQEPELMILDEPTAFLDLPRRVEIMHLLRQLTRSEGMTVLLSTHDLDIGLRTADSVWLMAPDNALYIGAPEDLVLDGSFQRVFRSEGVEFDVQSGNFQIHNSLSGEIALVGEGNPYIWTRRAIERIGFTVVSDHSPGTWACVEIMQDDQSSRWRLNHTKGCIEFDSIYHLVAELKTLPM